MIYESRFVFAAPQGAPGHQLHPGLHHECVAKPLANRLVQAGLGLRVARQLDAAVCAFHARPLKSRYRVLMLDGVVLARKTGAGAIRRPVLVALGLRPDGKKEGIDYRLAASESAAEWERFLTDLYRRGLDGNGLETICVDGGAGLLAALPVVFPAIPVQRCWAHKILNVLYQVRPSDRDPVNACLHAVLNSKPRPRALSAAGAPTGGDEGAAGWRPRPAAPRTSRL